MKVAYIAHPVQGNIEENLKSIVVISRKINLQEPDVIPFAPYFLDCHSMDDNEPLERNRGIKNNTALLKMGFVTELRLYGDRISSGMSGEIDLAIAQGIKIMPMTAATKAEYQKRWRDCKK